MNAQRMIQNINLQKETTALAIGTCQLLLAIE
jgi:hypothetical protein